MIKALRAIDLFGSASELRPPESGLFLTAWLACRREKILCDWIAEAIRDRPDNSREDEAAWWNRLEAFATESESGFSSDTTTIEHVRSLILTARALALADTNDESRQHTAIGTLAVTSYATEKEQAVAVLNRTLAGEPVLTSVTIPVAFDDEPNGCGLICRLHLEVLAGPPAVANYPEQWLDTSFNPEKLVTSMDLAWEGAKVEVFGDAEPHFCGRWRLWKWESESIPLHEPTGESLGAAAARGWATALTRAARTSGIDVRGPLVADPRVLVIGEIKRESKDRFTVAPVSSEGVYQKVCAIADVPCDSNGNFPIDRVVVVGAANAKKANAALATAKLVGSVDVKQLDAS